MKPYLVTATSQHGKRDSFLRDAESIVHLRGMLEREGFRDIEFVDDDFSARLRAEGPEEFRNPSQADGRIEAKLRTGSATGSLWLGSMRNNAVLILVALLGIGYGLWSGRYLWVFVGVGMLVFWISFVRKAMARADDYGDLVRAGALDDRAHARALIEKMSVDPSLTANEQLQVDLKFRHAGLRARDGDLAGALAEVELLRGHAQCAKGIFESRLASLHYQAGDMPRFVEYMEEASANSGLGQMQLLDVAFAHARVGDAKRARELMAQVDRRNLSTMHAPIAQAVDGMLSIRDGDSSWGIEQLRAAFDGFSQFAAKPAVWPIHGILVGWLALALLDAGRSEDALAVLAPWRKVALVSLDPERRLRIQNELVS